MQVRFSLPWIVGIPLRLIGALWPLSTEVLALLWWGKTVGPLTILAAAVLVVAYAYLCFAPNKWVFSIQGYVVAAILIGTSCILAITNLSGGNEMPEILPVHIGFGLAWLAVIWMARRQQVPSPG